MTPLKNKVVLGYSGGVDSTTAAILLKEMGFDVHAVCILMGCEMDGSAELIADRLNIPLTIIDARKDFNAKVAKETIEQYSKGFTPNPCIICNPEIKWKYLQQFADDNQIDKVASGHYARIIEKDGQFFLAKDQNKERDQSYFLYRLNKSILPRMILPLGTLTREGSEAFLEEQGILQMVTHKSRDLCILPNKGNKAMRGFLDRNLEMLEGDIVYHDGRIIGRHPSLQSLTIGQRKGLGITWESPLFVLDIDLEKRKVIVGEKHFLYKTTFAVTNTNFLVDDHPSSFDCLIKIRNTHQGTKGKVVCQNNLCQIELDSPVAGITPGQSAVFYDDEGIVIGGGIIGR